MAAVSRVPVELWQKIIEMVIFTTDILNPDPYDVPHSKLFERAVYMRSQDPFPIKRTERARQFRKIRLVCTAWNSLVLSFPAELISSLSSDASDDDPPNERGLIVRTSRASSSIKILRTPSHPACSCRFRESCQACAWPRHPGDGRRRIDNPLAIQVTEGIDYVKYLTLTSLLDCGVSLAHLQGISVFWGTEVWKTMDYMNRHRLKEISIRMPSLVHLELFVRWNEGVTLPLDFPLLKSLDIRCYKPRALMDQKWNLPSLTAFLFSTFKLDIDDTLRYLKNNAPNLTFLSLLVEDSFNTKKNSDIWTSFPRLIALRSSVDFFLANLPPPTHPLRHFMTGEPSKPVFYRYSSDPDPTLPSKLLTAVKGWPNCQSVFLEELRWNGVFRPVSDIKKRGVPIASHTGATDIMESEHLRVGLEMEELGVRYEDTYGLSFTEACDKFGGTDPRESVKAYVAAFRVLAEGESSSS